MTLLLFFEVKAVIEEHYERRIEFYRYVNPPLSREAERELGEWKGKVRGITGAWHWNKKYWNQIAITHGDVPEALIRSLIDHSYDEVVKKLPRKLRDQLKEEE